jgi:1-deoxy-D-xylulose-5-phosphate reductoisomerase
VHAFLSGRLTFLGIPAVIEGTLEQVDPAPIRAFETLYEADRHAREVAADLVGAFAA